MVWATYYVWIVYSPGGVGCGVFGCFLGVGFGVVLCCLCLCIIVWYLWLRLGCLFGRLVIGSCGGVADFVFGWFVGFGLSCLFSDALGLLVC